VACFLIYVLHSATSRGQWAGAICECSAVLKWEKLDLPPQYARFETAGANDEKHFRVSTDEPGDHLPRKVAVSFHLENMCAC